MCTPKVLLLTGDDNEVCSLRDVLGRHASLFHARGLSEMKLRLEGDFDVLFCSSVYFRQGALKEITKLYPELPVIVLSRAGGDEEWMEVLGAGAFDLLVCPCQEPGVRCLMQQAVDSHQARKAQRFSPIAHSEIPIAQSHLQ
jgi:DNA-binding NtrC family response regulator